MNSGRRKKPKSYWPRRMFVLTLLVAGSFGAVKMLTPSTSSDVAQSKPSRTPSKSVSPPLMPTVKPTDVLISPIPSSAPSELESFGPVEVPNDTYKNLTLVPGNRTCASVKDGSLSQVSASKTCDKNQLDLGYEAITAGPARPSELDAGLQARFTAVQLAAKASAKLDLQITSGWRSLEFQAQLFENSVKKNGTRAEALKWVALPEVSMHPWGLAVDINYTEDGREEASWVELHGSNFGLCRVYDNEWWHFEPVIAPGGKCPVRKPNANFAVAATPSPTATKSLAK